MCTFFQNSLLSVYSAECKSENKSRNSGPLLITNKRLLSKSIENSLGDQQEGTYHKNFGNLMWTICQNAVYTLNDMNLLQGPHVVYEAEWDWVTWSCRCITNQQPLVWAFDSSFHHVPHSFCQKEYVFTKNVDKHLLDYMECTIAA